VLVRPSSGPALWFVDGGVAAPGLAEASHAPHVAVGLGGPCFDLLGVGAVCLSLGYKISGVR
jgi:hypothetical protein